MGWHALKINQFINQSFVSILTFLSSFYAEKWAYEQVLDDQQELIYSSFVRTQDVA